MDKPLVSIILVNYKGLTDTIDCIESLLKITYSNFKIIVVDNNSGDDFVEVINEKFKNVILIKNKENIGFAGGCNIGINFAIEQNTDYVLLLNNDTVVEPNFLDLLVDTYMKNDKTGIVSGKILYYDNHDYIWYGGGHINQFKGNGQTKHLNEKDTIAIKSSECTFCSGCCMLISKDIIKSFGGLSEDYFLYFEDTDYCMNLIKKGYKIYFDSRVVIYHKESKTTKKYSQLYTYYICRNRLIFIIKNLNCIYKPFALIYTFGYFIKKIIISEFKFKYVIIGTLDAFKGIKGKKEFIGR